MFEHGKTKQKYYSVREKINYYQNIINGKIVNVPNLVKRKAPLRLKSLRKINQNVYDEPTLIVTNDKHFGNKKNGLTFQKFMKLNILKVLRI